MAKFIVRVVLHSKKQEHPDYEKLHSKMEIAGFSRTIKNDDGVEYHLPPAEYIIALNRTGIQVREMVKVIVNKIDEKNGIIVSLRKRSYWSNLKKVN